jgi:hypothetical protein
MYNLALRVGDPNLPILDVGVLTAQDVGGNLAGSTTVGADCGQLEFDG